MSRITKFSQIPAQLKYPPQSKGKLSQIHSEIITAVIAKHELTLKDLKQVIQLINTISYKVLKGDNISWTNSNPLNFSDLVNDIDARDYLLSQNMYVAFNDINWESDEIVKVMSTASATSIETSTTPEVETTKPVISVVPKSTSKLFVTPTPKEDLYLKPPVIPRFTPSAVFASVVYDDTLHCIYNSVPTIPQKQNEISITTNVMQMTSKDLYKLYPNHFIRTRAAALYEPISKLEMLDDLGAVLPITHFTRDQVIDNIIKYPHLYKLLKVVDDQIVSFYTTIEIDGELKRTADIWNMLPESDKIPYNSDYIKEYVARRYLLERDIDGVHHKYPLFGTLDPYLTLFTTPEDYIKYGYSDLEDIAKRCVNARVSYKQSRNPILRRMKDA